MDVQGAGKTSKCLDEIKDKLLENPEGNPILYIVPEQMTFLSEYQLIHTPGLGGMIRAQVFSFTRLALEGYLQETGGMSRYHLNSTGISMLIQKIIEDKKEELHLIQYVQPIKQVLLVEWNRCLSSLNVIVFSHEN